jgi:hypothetical protein
MVCVTVATPVGVADAPAAPSGDGVADEPHAASNMRTERPTPATCRLGVRWEKGMTWDTSAAAT